MNDAVQILNRRLNYLISEIDALYHTLAVQAGLSDSVMISLSILSECGGSCKLSLLHQRTGLPKQTVNSALRKLESGGHIYLKQADGKSKIVCLTEQGFALAVRTVVKVAEMENEIFAAWPREDLQKHLDLTERYLRDLREKIKHLETDTQ